MQVKNLLKVNTCRKVAPLDLNLRTADPETTQPPRLTKLSFLESFSLANDKVISNCDNHLEACESKVKAIFLSHHPSM